MHSYHHALDTAAANLSGCVGIQCFFLPQALVIMVPDLSHHYVSRSERDQPRRASDTFTRLFAGGESAPSLDPVSRSS